MGCIGRKKDLGSDAEQSHKNGPGTQFQVEVVLGLQGRGLYSIEFYKCSAEVLGGLALCRELEHHGARGPWDLAGQPGAPGA